MGDQPFVLVTGNAGFVKIQDEGNSASYRAIAIATEQKFEDVQAEITRMLKHTAKWRNGKPKRAVACYEYLAKQGWHWTTTMTIGSGCKVHLTADELPVGRLIVKISKRLVAVIDGTIHDTTDPSRDGKRCVYGYWSKA